MRLYNKVKSVLEPQNEEVQKKEQIQDVIGAKVSSRITAPVVVTKRKKSKVSGPELNHDYISYSDIKIRYR